MATRREIKLSWETIENAIDALAYELEPIQPKLIVGICRGGLIPATMISHRLQVPMVSVSAETYKGTRMMRQQTVRIPQDVIAKYHEAMHHTVVVDDVIDTGKTHKAIMSWFPTAKFAAILTKKPEIQSLWFAKVQPKTWVHFPWEQGR